MEDEHGPHALADDEVAFPMANVSAGFDVFWSTWTERGRSHSQASWTSVDRNRGLPALDTPCSRSISHNRSWLCGLKNSGRLKRTTIVALVRKLLVALWKYVTAGVVIEGAVMKAARR
jgi:hypothetical protein